MTCSHCFQVGMSAERQSQWRVITTGAGTLVDRKQNCNRLQVMFLSSQKVCWRSSAVEMNNRVLTSERQQGVQQYKTGFVTLPLEYNFPGNIRKNRSTLKLQHSSKYCFTPFYQKCSLMHSRDTQTLLSSSLFSSIVTPALMLPFFCPPHSLFRF